MSASTPAPERLAMLADGPLLSPTEAARLLAVKPSWVYEAVRDRRMPCLRVGRHIRFTRQMLDQWLAENREG
jgi:excisionase family DNA binding protein